MPAGLIEDDNGVRARFDPGGDLVEMKLHGFADAGRKHEGGAGPTFGADCPEQIGRLGTLVVNSAWPQAFAGPAIGQLVLLPDAHLVLKPHLYRRARREARLDFRHACGKVFLNASTASASCL